MPSVNKRILKVPIAYTKKLTERIKDEPLLINLSRGDPEFQTPAPVIDYLCKILPDIGENSHDLNSLEGKWTHYEKEQGSVHYREAIARKYQRESAIDIPIKNILVTNGGMNAIFLSILAIANSGDEILIPDPSFIAYDPISNYVIPGIRGIRVRLNEKNAFVPTIDQLEEARTKSTKALVLTSPMNPTGTLYGKADLEKIMKWAIDNDIFVIHDENHEKEVYENAVHIPIRALDPMGEHSILLGSLSRLGMGGWRSGWIVGPENVIESARLAHSYVNMTCNTFVQECGAYVLDHFDELGYDTIYKGNEEKRNFFVSELNRLDGFSCIMPQSTCYAFPNIRAFYDRYCSKILPYLEASFAQDMSKNPTKKEELEKELEMTKESRSCAVHQFLLRFARVGVIPGIAYGPASDDYVRMSFSVKKEAVAEAIRRLQGMYQLFI